MNNFPRLGDDHPRRIAVLRALQLGDLLCAVPALRALRNAFPGTEITLVGLPWARQFVARFQHLLDGFIDFPGYPGLREQTPEIRRFPGFLEEVQAMEFDLALQLHGSGGISNPLIQLFGAQASAGFYLPGQYCPDPARYLEYPVHEPEIWRHLRMVEFMGLPLHGDDLEFPLNEADWEEFESLLDEHQLRGTDYICIHPGAREESRRWPAESFTVVADGLAGRGFQVVLTGTNAEREITSAVASAAKHKITDLSGRTSLGGIAALLKRARVLVCNDTGVSHIAAALRTPSAVLFTDSDPERWAPLDRSIHHIIPYATAVTPEIVLSEVDQLLQQERVNVF